MRWLFDIDKKDYTRTETVFSRPSARAVIIENGRVAMVHSLKYGYYKFPGGGIEPGEEPISALVREVREETGLIVDITSVREYGMVHRVQKGDHEDVFIQDNFYYLCAAHPGGDRELDPYEAEEGFTLELVTPEAAIRENEKNIAAIPDPVISERENGVLRRLMEEGYFDGQDRAGGAYESLPY